MTPPKLTQEQIEKTISDEALIEHIRYENGSLDLAISVPEVVSHHFARLALMALKDCENYFAGELKFKGAEYEFHIKKSSGMSPSRKALKLEAELQAARDENENLRKALENIENSDDCGTSKSIMAREALGVKGEQ